MDLRGIAERGHVWDVTRPPRRKGKRSSLTAHYVETRDPEKLRLPFDVVPILRTVFHVEALELNALNPLPARTVLEPSVEELAADAPEVVARDDEREEELRKDALRRLREERERGGKKDPPTSGARYY